MRTKTLALSALLGMLGTAAAVAQTNVYSINAVGYINVTLFPGYNIVTCPLICSPDNTIGNLMNNSNGAFQLNSGPAGQRHAFVYQYGNGQGYISSDETGNFGGNGWENSGTITINPGQAVYFYNPGALGSGSNMIATFVGQVPQANNNTNVGGMTNALVTGFNLVGSMIPISGDLISNNITSMSNGSAFIPGKHDVIDIYDPTYDSSISAQGGYVTGGSYAYTPALQWDDGGAGPDPTLAYVYEGFWYFVNAANTTNSTWVENFTINP